jgi:hypothetical protein
MKKYSITENLTGDEIIIAENEDGTVSSFSRDPANPDYQAYLAAQSTPSVD